METLLERCARLERRRVGGARAAALGIGRRLAALALGLVLAPLVLELGLRAAALFVTGERRVESSARILCQGDSNTYGLHLPEAHAYPAQLEALLEPIGSNPAATVANLGVPSKTSWVVAEELREDLERYAPAAVVVLVGVNDLSDRKPSGSAGHFFDGLRTVKMARRLLAQWGAAREPASKRPAADEEVGESDVRRRYGTIEGYAVNGEGGAREMHFVDRTGRARPFQKVFGAPDPERATVQLEEELKGIVELVRAHGAVPILLSYPLETGRMAHPRRAIRAAAEATGARLVDPLPAFARAQQRVDLSQLLFRDKHATQLGNSIVARLLANALAEEGLIELAAPFDPLEEVARFQPPALSLEAIVEDGALVGLRARYASGSRLQFVLSGARGSSPFEWRGMIWPIEDGTDAHALPLALDKLARVCLKRSGRHLVTTGADGVAEVRFDELELRLAAELAELWAAAVVVEPGQHVSAVSDALRLR